METKEIKQKIQDQFIEITEDKFTRVKRIKCKQDIIWKGKVLENKFMNNDKSYLGDELKMSIDYRQVDDVDSIFFKFFYTNHTGLNPGMKNIKMYVILDDNKNIELSESSGFDCINESNVLGIINLCIETAQIEVSMSDLIAISNAKKIEYSIRFGHGALEGIFQQNEMIIFKGFYNATFDSDFEIDLFKEIEIKNKEIEIKKESNNDIFSLNELQKNLILDQKETLFRLDNGLHKWRNKYQINGEIIFGISPNPFDKNMPNIFTSEGIYAQSSGETPRFISYQSEPDFTFKKGWLGNCIIDNKSKFEIEIGTINLKNESDKKIIDTILNFIQKEINEFDKNS